MRSPPRTGSDRRSALCALTAVLLAAACRAPVPRTPEPLGAPAQPGLAAPEADASGLPPVPFVQGPLALRVTYPPADARIEAGDSSFIFGTTGAGDATLTINGAPVRVWPNGAFLGWVRFPPGPTIAFDLVARSPRDTARLAWTVARAPRFLPPAAALWVDTTSFAPAGQVWWPRDEVLPVTVRATPGASVALVLPSGARIPLVAETEPAVVPEGIRAFDRDPRNLDRGDRADRYRGMLRGAAIGAAPGPVLGAGVEARTAPGATLEVARGRDTVRIAWPLRVALLDTMPRIAELDDDPDRRGTGDGITVGRATPGATYHWFFPRGTRARVTGRINGDLRLRIGPDEVAWVPAAEARLVPGAGVAAARVGSVTMTPRADRTVVRIPVSHRVPFRVHEEERRLVLELYGSVGDVNWVRFGAETADRRTPLVRATSWHQAGSAVRLAFDLAAPVWGFRTRWERNDLVLEIRRPPVIDDDAPLRDRLIMVDPGHPPAGATGPTGLTEAEANLAISLRLADLLRRAGARVILTRETPAPLALGARPAMADSLDAELLISVHNNALPDGVNPFPNHGSSVFYNHPRSIPLARTIQRALVARLGTRDLGVARGDLALVRPTWMPSVLTEGLFMMVPDQEAALRSPEGQERYARAVFDGVRAFLVEAARAERP